MRCRECGGHGAVVDEGGAVRRCPVCDGLGDAPGEFWEDERAPGEKEGRGR